MSVECQVNVKSQSELDIGGLVCKLPSIFGILYSEGPARVSFTVTGCVSKMFKSAKVKTGNERERTDLRCPILRQAKFLPFKELMVSSVFAPLIRSYCHKSLHESIRGQFLGFDSIDIIGNNPPTRNKGLLINKLIQNMDL